jgi:ABC-type transport system involved in cytochrome bd biosynthesis fused ATPase/permease subunit
MSSIPCDGRHRSCLRPLAYGRQFLVEHRLHHNGLITVDGIDVKRIRKDSLRDSMGMVLQDTHLFDGSVMGNIRCCDHQGWAVY